MKKVTNTTKEVERNPARNLLEMMANPDDHVERSERRGQQELVASDLLPSDLSGATKDDFVSLGFEFHGAVPEDPLFQFVTLPEGWKRVGSDHDMWSYIEDEHGTQRVGVFYKAAFYDRRAHANIIIE